MPVRVGFRPTSSIVTSDPGSAAAATIQNAADEISPGTCTIAAGQPLAPLTATAVPARRHLDAERLERPLRVIACRRAARRPA